MCHNLTWPRLRERVKKGASALDNPFLFFGTLKISRLLYVLLLGPQVICCQVGGGGRNLAISI